MTRRARTSGPWGPCSSPPRSSSPFIFSCCIVLFCRTLLRPRPILHHPLNSFLICFIVVLSSPPPSRFFFHWSFPRNVLNSLGRLANKRPQISRIGNYVGHWLFPWITYTDVRTFFNCCETSYLGWYVLL